MKIAVSATEFIGWGGGRDFITGIISALFSVAQRYDWKVDLLVTESTTGVLQRSLPFYRKALTTLMQGRLPDDFFPTGNRNREREATRTMLREMNPYVKVVFVPTPLDRQLIQHKYDVVIPILDGRTARLTVPWVGYIYDFQHRYFPEFFRPEDVQARDNLFHYNVTHARSVIVNSKAAREDIKRFIPDATSRIFTLPWAPRPVREWLEDDPSLLTPYNLPTRYLAMCSQFWVHKQHLTALQALKLLHLTPSLSDVHLVCTGETEDHRFPEYFQQIRTFINDNHLNDRVHFLGYIPKRDQIEILKHSLALLQPTLFEGGPGGGAVYDAAAVGTPCIISDIPVNLEIQDASVRFFRARDAEHMASQIIDLLRERPDRPSAEELLARRRPAFDQLAETLEEAVSHALSHE